MSFIEKSLSQRLLDLEKGDHMCCLYGTEDEHSQLLTPLSHPRTEPAPESDLHYRCAHWRPGLDYLEKDGVKVETPLGSGQLSLITASDSYLKDGEFDPERMIRMLDLETEKAINEGFSALRVTGEMSWALRNCPGSGRLIEYEVKLNDFIPERPIVALCQYDRRRFGADILRDVLRTHPIAVIGNEMYDNIYFVIRNIMAVQLRLHPVYSHTEFANLRRFGPS